MVIEADASNLVVAEPSGASYFLQSFHTHTEATGMKLTKCIALAMAFGVLTTGSVFASSIDELAIVSGSTSITITDNGSTDTNPATGAVAYSNGNFNGWNIAIVGGTSNSPVLTPFGLDLASLTATCTGGACANSSLDVFYTATGFTDPTGSADGFTTTFSTPETGTGTATELAWYSTLNTVFSEQQLIGINGNNGGSVSDGPNGAGSLYSLTLEEIFTTSGTSAVSFSADANITEEIPVATPEPASATLTLLGTVALMAGTQFRRTFRATRSES
jgi:hypothetical protein